MLFAIPLRRRREDVSMDDQQRDLLLVACREAYRCLADRNRPEILVEGRLVHSDAELAGALRHFARRLFTLQAEHSRLLHEIQPLWEAQISGALVRLLDAVEHVQAAELDGWPDRRPATAMLREADMALLRALASVSEYEQPPAEHSAGERAT
jgi:hypothetical protein